MFVAVFLIPACTRAGALPPPGQAHVADGAGVQTPAAPEPAISAQALEVSRIAERNGDKTFLMVDKARGEIILFENDKPSFSGPALTGASMGDRIPPKVLTFYNSHPLTTDQKVTPAGRFTVTPELDPEYGHVWTINEIQGKDWDIAIHRVYLGTPSEHREARIHSANPDDRHITFGCINVEPATIQVLARKLPRKGKVPLYVLPRDQSMTAALFPRHAIATAAAAARSTP